MNAQPTVFVVDDDQAFRKSLAMLLGSLGIKHELFSTGKDFLDQFDAERLGCLVLDLKMPEMNGVEVVQELVRRGATIPIIVVSGHEDDDTAAISSVANVRAFLEKPFSADALIDVIREFTSDAADGDF